MTVRKNIVKVNYARSPIFKKYTQEGVINQLKIVGFSEKCCSRQNQGWDWFIHLC